MLKTSWRANAARLLIVGLLAATLLPSAASAAAKPGLTPIVLFPAYHLTRLRVDVHNQTVDRKFDPSGTFEYWFQNPQPSPRFQPQCREPSRTRPCLAG